MSDLRPLADQYAEAVGGFVPPAFIYGPPPSIRDLLPRPAAWGAHFFRDPAEAWAHQREQQLRDERQAREAEHELAAVEWRFEYPTYRRDP